MHCLCWTITCLCAFLPLSTNPYGQDDVLSQQMPCNFSGAPLSGFDWSVATFASILLACAATMFLCMSHVFYRWLVDDGPNSTWNAREYAIFQTTRMYPVAMLVCWIPFLAIGVLTPVTRVHTNATYFILMLLSSQFGTFLTIVFFVYCRVAIRQWRRIFGLSPLECDMTIRESSMSEITSSQFRQRSVDRDRVISSTEFNVSTAKGVVYDGDDYDDSNQLYQIDSDVNRNIAKDSVSKVSTVPSVPSIHQQHNSNSSVFTHKKGTGSIVIDHTVLNDMINRTSEFTSQPFEESEWSAGSVASNKL